MVLNVHEIVFVCFIYFLVVVVVGFVSVVVCVCGGKTIKRHLPGPVENCAIIPVVVVVVVVVFASFCLCLWW